MSTDKIFGWMVPFHVSWRANGGGTKVWFRIFHHVGRDFLHVLPMLVALTLEAKERMCASFVISCFPDEDFEEA